MLGQLLAILGVICLVIGVVNLLQGALVFAIILIIVGLLFLGGIGWSGGYYNRGL